VVTDTTLVMEAMVADLTVVTLTTTLMETAPTSLLILSARTNWA